MKNQIDNNYNSTIIKNSVRNISIIFIKYYQLEKKYLCIWHICITNYIVDQLYSLQRHNFV